MESRYKVGQKVKIIGKTNDHSLHKGDEAVIIHGPKPSLCGGMYYRCDTGITASNVHEKDIVLVEEKAPVEAAAILEDAASILRERGKARDSEEGERSMARAVRIFNAMVGTELTEEQGWKFMIALKFARMAGGKFHFDDFIDTVGYSALLAECAGKEALAV